MPAETEQPKTKAGRDPEGAEKQIAAQPQERSTCPACDGTKRLVGRYIGSASREDPDEHIFACSNCDDDGTVPAGPQGDLAAWREEVRDLLWRYERGLAGSLPKLRAHLAAMPQAQPDAVMLRVLKAVDEGLAAIEPEFQAGPLVVVRTMQGSVRAAIAQHEQGAAG